MKATTVLAQLQNQGLTLSTDGDRLFVEPRSAITDEARTLIRFWKDELLALLVELANADLDIQTLALRIADKYHTTAEQCLSILDDDDIQAITTDSDPERTQAWRVSVGALVYQGLMGTKS